MATALLLLIFGICSCGINLVATDDKLIVVLIDGCRWNYIDDPKIQLKGIPKMLQNGVRAQYVNPVFPSLSYPNWYSIVTGLYPESHNIINNIMYDNETGSPFLMLPHKGATDKHWWNGAEPIWVTSEKQGKNAALYWWAGCEVEIRGVQPMICERHRYGPGTEEEKVDFLERVDDVLAMFKPQYKSRLNLALMYYGPVDYNGHYSGPDAPETVRALKDIDEVLYNMLQKIEDAGLKNKVNVMVVSDHGMTDVREHKYIDLEKFAPYIKLQVASGATSMLVPEDGMLDKLYQELKASKIKGMKIFKKEEIPTSYHLSRSPLICDIFLQAEKGFLIKALKNPDKRVGELPGQYIGYHGFHPDEVTDMRTVFFATGPDFRRGYVSPPVSNVDLYNVMCNILQILPLPNNGSSEYPKDVISVDDNSVTSSSYYPAPHVLYSLVPCIIMLTVLSQRITKSL